MSIQRFEDLDVWMKARELTKLVYQINYGHDYRLRDQITAATVSIMNNIAEGFDSQSNLEFIRFLRYSRRSSSEVQNCLYVLLDQRRIFQDTFDQLYSMAERIRRMIDGLLRYLRAKRTQQAQPAKQS